MGSHSNHRKKTTVSHVQTRPNLRPRGCHTVSHHARWLLCGKSGCAARRAATRLGESEQRFHLVPLFWTGWHNIYIHLIYNDIYIYMYIYIYMLYVICYMTCLDVYNDIYIYTCYMLYDLSRWDMTVCVLHHHIWQFFVRSFHCSWSVNIPTCDSDCHLVSPH